MFESPMPHVETDHIAKEASLDHKNVTPSGLPTSHPSNASILKYKRKLLVLDVNGLLGHVVSMDKVYKRPFCDDFLKFCIEKFNVMIWSSRKRHNLEKVLGHVMEKNIKKEVLLCWLRHQ
ncbi:putative FCP1 homology domain-containing protein C1271.03c [Silene latifolia]|uniref:putative FCP1 homology domain-containing protein C1271.03c n=1 Tax=Silene latifolia TaxID=37657 RepID=UPI003D774126